MRFPAIACVVLAGCATAPASDSSRLCAGRQCYRIGTLGPGWVAVARHDGTVSFFNAESGAVIQSNATCRATADADTVPLESLTNHLLVGYTGRTVRSTERVDLARREALHTVIEARLDGVPLVLDLFVMKGNGCVFDLSHAAPVSSYPAGTADFQRFVAGFDHTLEARR